MQGSRAKEIIAAAGAAAVVPKHVRDVVVCMSQQPKQPGHVRTAEGREARDRRAGESDGKPTGHRRRRLRALLLAACRRGMVRAEKVVLASSVIAKHRGHAVLLGHCNQAGQTHARRVRQQEHDSEICVPAGGGRAAAGLSRDAAYECEPPPKKSAPEPVWSNMEPTSWSANDKGSQM